MKVGCLGAPCESGTCEETPEEDYTCNCFPGFEGTHCEKGAMYNYGRGVLRVVSDGDVAMGTKMKPQKIHQAREVNICLLSLKSPVFSLKRINFPNLSSYR